MSGILMGYVGIALEHNYLFIAISNGLFVKRYYEEQLASLEHVEEHIVEVLQSIRSKRQYTTGQPVKPLAAGISLRGAAHSLCSLLWLRLDVIPFVINWKSPAVQQAYSNALKVDKYFNLQSRSELSSNIAHAAHLYCLPSLGFQYEVKVDFERAVLFQLADVQKTVSPDAWNLRIYTSSFFCGLFPLVLCLARESRQKRIVLTFISSTPQGGGVALMRHALIRLLRNLNVDAHWHVLRPSTKAFKITKLKFHNVLQGVSAPGVVLQPQEKRKYMRWSANNARFLEETIQKSTVIVCDDPQTAGLLPHIRACNPHAKLVYRSHIQIRADLIRQTGSPQAVTWEFLWQFIQLADVFVSHPVLDFVPDDVPRERVVLMPASTEPLDGLNKELTPHDEAVYMSMLNAHLVRSQVNTPISRPYVAQVARFDPSKGILDLMEAYRCACAQLKAAAHPTPQLVLAGHGAVDDPEAATIVSQVLALRESEKFKAIADDIKVAVLPANDQLLNVVVAKSQLVYQLSRREGFEVKVTEAQLKGKAIIASRAGGIPLQVIDGVNGLLVEPGNIETVAKLTVDLLTDDAKRLALGASAKRHVSSEFLTPANARNWLFIALSLVKNEMPAGNMQFVSDLVQKTYSPARCSLPTAVYY